jgi:hypothetical protein
MHIGQIEVVDVNPVDLHIGSSFLFALHPAPQHEQSYRHKDLRTNETDRKVPRAPSQARDLGLSKRILKGCKDSSLAFDKNASNIPTIYLGDGIYLKSAPFRDIRPFLGRAGRPFHQFAYA